MYLSRSLKWHIIMRQLDHYYPLCQVSPLLPLHCLVLVVRPGGWLPGKPSPIMLGQLGVKEYLQKKIIF